MTFMDKTFCGSPNCKNECGRKLTPELQAQNLANSWVSYAYFCGTPNNEQNNSAVAPEK